MKIIAILMILLFPLSVLAEPKSIILKKGEKSPWTGLLLNSSAQAKIIADKDTQKKLCANDIKYTKEIQQEHCKFDLSMRKVELDSQKSKYTQILKLKETEIDKLHDHIKKNSGTEKSWWLGLGILSGVVISVVAFVAASSASK